MEHIRFLSLNGHGLSSDIISYLRSVVYNYDFVLLQETWLSNANSHRLTRHQSGVFSGRPFGGTAILVRSVFANTHNSLLCVCVIQVRRKWCLYAVE